MNRSRIVSLSVVFVFVILGLGSSDTEKSFESGVSSAQPDMEVKAAVLYNDYERNEVAGDEKYKGKILRVSGSVDDISKDITDTMYITLDAGQAFGSVQCFFADDHTEELSGISKGQYVTIQGRCDGKLGNIFLRGCSIK